MVETTEPRDLELRYALERALRRCMALDPLDNSRQDFGDMNGGASQRPTEVASELERALYDEGYPRATLRSTSRDSEVREAIEALRALSDAADAEQAAEDKMRSRKGRFLPSFFDTTARYAFQNAAVNAIRAILDRSSEAAPTRTWPGRDDLAAMSAAEVNAFLASRGLDVRVVEDEAAPVVGLSPIHEETLARAIQSTILTSPGEYTGPGKGAYRQRWDALTAKQQRHVILDARALIAEYARLTQTPALGEPR